MLLVLK